MRRRLATLLAAGTALASATGVSAQDPNPSPTPPPDAQAVLATVQARGHLVCGVNGSLPGFSVLDEATGAYSGFDADFCRAVAAAVLGDPTKVEFRPLTAAQRGPALQTGEVDVLIRNTTWTISRDNTWGEFAPTTFYDGQGLMVRGDLGVSSLEDLAGATICVQSGTTTELNITDAFRARGLEFTPLVFAEIDPTYAAYDEGRCDAVTSDRSQLAGRRTTFADPAAHVILDDVLSKEPLGPVVPMGDPQWFDIVKWVVFATFEAEELGITSENVASMVGGDDPVVRRFLGDEGDLGQAMALSNDFVVKVISGVGNYGEIFARNLGPDTPFALERGLNALWKDGGLLYSPPFR